MNAPIPPVRIGLGYDSHRLGNGGPLRIGGIDVPAEVHAIGHSDADVLLHAITDALLGTVCEADIGRLFPDDADENRDRESRDFVHEAIRRVRHHSMDLVNVDCVILAERPRMAPHIDAMRQSIAEMLDITIDRVSVKAKTGEGLGAIGNEAAIATHVVVLVHALSSSLENMK
ncbi:2-C-methyl-D-erythritol 2,4-cyclodiphosphate synthase [Novipirellula artificiosorum]|uniref:2-C-methyl-D-erythritol 2,4-cyclodiphosphate synthase n=1 Tax=Novipirellula artificiosorum TaxID=2528016 RepID=A0A5C6E214_9BACT|nr:2-C-methyl-D-erythritol 2,4-cyclodiphosphate synthase [Novipirellula artificiosorum]TWU42017.1 2-C-methyl-D-erythritol 2,4-cyclodiphosphate synthase [Novipirellula artificiosorum]